VFGVPHGVELNLKNHAIWSEIRIATGFLKEITDWSKCGGFPENHTASMI
jgi:hypothetical protein